MGNKIQKKINYHFKDESILLRALTHKSKINESSNEVLEFLGDRVLSLIISEKLIEMYPFDREGILDKKLSNLVDKNACLKIAQKIDLMEFIILGSTEIQSEGNQKKSILSNCCEALIGAIYLDDGLKSAKKVILSTIWSHRELAWESVNFKGKLIELCHTKQMDNPKFLVSNVSGPEHKKLFEVKVKIGNNYYPSGIGSNKKTAEQQAAQLAIDSITD